MILKKEDLLEEVATSSLGELNLSYRRLYFIGSILYNRGKFLAKYAEDELLAKKIGEIMSMDKVYELDQLKLLAIEIRTLLSMLGNVPLGNEEGFVGSYGIVNRQPNETVAVNVKLLNEFSHREVFEMYKFMCRIVNGDFSVNIPKYNLL